MRPLRRRVEKLEMALTPSDLQPGNLSVLSTAELQEIESVLEKIEAGDELSTAGRERVLALARKAGYGGDSNGKAAF